MASSKLKLTINVKPFFVKHPILLFLMIKLGLFRRCVDINIANENT